jgi:hypothetical protein
MVVLSRLARNTQTLCDACLPRELDASLRRVAAGKLDTHTLRK